MATGVGLLGRETWDGDIGSLIQGSLGIYVVLWDSITIYKLKCIQVEYRTNLITISYLPIL
jgi:hypothetical protein